MTLNETVKCALEYVEKLEANADAKAYLESFSPEDRFKVLRVIQYTMAQKQVESGVNMTNACYECKYRGNVPGDAHSCCNNVSAFVVGDDHGIQNGWFFYPFNFDPVWLRYCDSFEEKN